MAAAPADANGLEWSAAGLALEPGASGDLHVVLTAGELTLLAVIDGLGHGREACRAAEECAAILRAHPGLALADLVRICHDGLRATRGVALTLGYLDARNGLLDWVGIGNVEGLVWRESSGQGKVLAAVLSRGGVVGYRLPSIQPSRVVLAPKDLIVFATDGIAAGFAEVFDANWSPEELANCILMRFGKRTDDALVLVVRHRGTQGS